MDLNVHVNGKKIGQQVTFECPFCYTKYNKDGRPSKRARRLFHFHGLGGTSNLSNDETTTLFRVPHCRNGKFPKEKSLFKIQV